MAYIPVHTNALNTLSIMKRGTIWFKTS